MTLQIIESPAKVAHIEPAIQSLKRLYAFRRPEEVSQFLKAHPFLVSLAIEAHDKIGDYFGLQTTVILEVVTDPEAIGDRELFAFIQTSLTSQEALDRLDRLDQEWWLDAADRSEGKLCFHVEYE
jgi:hypothetical protein